MKIYNVYHEYDTDGGFGDAIAQSDLVATFATETDAKAFVEKYSKPYVYDRPYAALYCNQLIIRRARRRSLPRFSSFPSFRKLKSDSRNIYNFRRRQCGR